VEPGRPPGGNDSGAVRVGDTAVEELAGW